MASKLMVGTDNSDRYPLKTYQAGITQQTATEQFSSDCTSEKHDSTRRDACPYTERNQAFGARSRRKSILAGLLFDSLATELLVPVGAAGSHRIHSNDTYILGAAKAQWAGHSNRGMLNLFRSEESLSI
jgi:hypothetical protein